MGDNLFVPARDTVSKVDLNWAYAHPGDDAPETAWFTTEEVARATVEPLIEGDELQIFVQDEAGNQTIYLARPFHGQWGGGGCNCDATGGGPNAGSLILILVTGGLLVVGRRTFRSLW